MKPFSILIFNSFNLLDNSAYSLSESQQIRYVKKSQEDPIVKNI